MLRPGIVLLAVLALALPAGAAEKLTMVHSDALLLEASDTGPGAIPLSGAVTWSTGMDDQGVPTIIAEAQVPHRGLAFKLTLRRNHDASVPAVALMEIEFDVSDAFPGKSIAKLPGVLGKTEQLVQGVPLIGASARVVGNDFLFALSAAPDDVVANDKLLGNSTFIDLALIYETGKRAIVTLSLDTDAQALVRGMLAAWDKEPLTPARVKSVNG